MLLIHFVFEELHGFDEGTCSSSHGIVDQGIGNFFDVLRDCVEQTGGGDIIDLPRHTCGVVMDEFFGST